MNKLIITMLVAGCLTACSSSKSTSVSSSTSSQSTSETPQQVTFPGKVIGGKVLQPQARIYKIPAQYADLVPVNIVDGRLVSFPAPSDITEATAPVALADGWLLDRQGITPNSSFLRWTRSEYHAMTNAPTPAEIMEAVIRDAHVTSYVELPMTASAAAADTAAVNSYIEQHLQ